MSNRFVVALLAMLVAQPASAASVNLVQNGDFSSGFSYWDLAGDTTYLGTKGPNATLGSYSNVTLSQIVPTIAGYKYDFSFALANDADPIPEIAFGNEFSASVNGTQVYSVVDTPRNMTYQLYSFSFLAQENSMISFSSRNDTGYFFLTDVSVTQTSPVPLPAALPLFGGALLGAIGIRRRANKLKAKA